MSSLRCRRAQQTPRASSIRASKLLKQSQVPAVMPLALSFSMGASSSARELLEQSQARAVVPLASTQL
eukprot:6188055-Pleurochrysis_carterae.AAC.3